MIEQNATAVWFILCSISILFLLLRRVFNLITVLLEKKTLPYKY